MDKVQIIEIGHTRSAYRNTSQPWITFELNSDNYMHFADKIKNPNIWDFLARPMFSLPRLDYIDSRLDGAYAEYVCRLFDFVDKAPKYSRKDKKLLKKLDRITKI